MEVARQQIRELGLVERPEEMHRADRLPSLADRAHRPQHVSGGRMGGMSGLALRREQGRRQRRPRSGDGARTQERPASQVSRPHAIGPFAGAARSIGLVGAARRSIALSFTPKRATVSVFRLARR